MDFTGDRDHQPWRRRAPLRRRRRRTASCPGLLWTPEGADGTAPPRPDRPRRHEPQAHRPTCCRSLDAWCATPDYAVAAIDAPYHGDRATPEDAAVAHRTPGPSESWSVPATDRMIADWHATDKELQQLDEVGDGPLGYWGLSMGTMLGPARSSPPRPRSGARCWGSMGTFTDEGSVDRRGVRRSRARCCSSLQTDDELVPLERRPRAVPRHRLARPPPPRPPRAAQRRAPSRRWRPSEAFFAQHSVTATRFLTPRQERPATPCPPRARSTTAASPRS